MKLLIVEDEPKAGDYLKQGLTEAGFVVDLARTGDDGMHAALTGTYDLVILDGGTCLDLRARLLVGLRRGRLRLRIVGVGGCGGEQ